MVGTDRCMVGRLETVPWRRKRGGPRIQGSVRVVALGARIADSSATGGVPVTRHSAMGSALVIAPLGAVALGAKPHRFVEADRAAIGQVQPAVIPLVVARQAGVPAVSDHQTLMEQIKIGSRSVFRVRRPGSVAGAAGDRQRVPIGRHQVGSGALGRRTDSGGGGVGRRQRLSRQSEWGASRRQRHGPNRRHGPEQRDHRGEGADRDQNHQRNHCDLSGTARSSAVHGVPFPVWSPS